MRGNIESTEALRRALLTRRKNYIKQQGIRLSQVHPSTSIDVSTASSRSLAPLQAVDYFTWALQRVANTGNNDYLSTVWHLVDFINIRAGLDRFMQPKSGKWHTKKEKLLSLEAFL